MDPQVTWDALLESLAAREWDRIDELARALLAWLDSGGFPPKTLGRDDLGSDFNRASRFTHASSPWPAHAPGGRSAAGKPHERTGGPLPHDYSWGFVSCPRNQFKKSPMASQNVTNFPRETPLSCANHRIMTIYPRCSFRAPARFSERQAACAWSVRSPLASSFRGTPHPGDPGLA